MPLPSSNLVAASKSRFLLQLARRGDNNALGTLLQRYRPYLVRIVERKLDVDLRVKEAVADVVQETLLEAWRGFDHFRGETVGELINWLCRILKSNLQDTRRRYQAEKRERGREQSLDVVLRCRPRRKALIVPALQPVETMIEHEELQLVNLTLARLPKLYRQVIFLRCDKDFSFEKIGAALNVGRKSARRLWQLAIVMLRSEMRKDVESR